MISSISENLLSHHKNLIIKRKSGSARINSACIQRNLNKYKLPNNQSKIPKQIDTQFQKDVQKQLNIYNQLPNSSSTPSLSFIKNVDSKCAYIKLRQEQKQTEQNIIEERRQEYLQFKQKNTQSRHSQHQGLTQFLQSDNSHLDGKFFKNHDKQEKQIFKPVSSWKSTFKQSPSKTLDPPNKKQTDDKKPKSRTRMNLNNKKQEMMNLAKENQKKTNERLAKDQNQYFQTLNEITQKNQDKFKDTIVIKNKWQYDFLREPKNDFTSYRDLNYKRQNILEDPLQNEQQLQKDLIYKRQSLHDDPVQNDQSKNSRMNSLMLIVDKDYQKQIDSFIYSEQVSIYEVKQVIPPEIQIQENNLNLNSEDQARLDQFWRDIRINQKDRIRFALILHPEFISARDKLGKTPLHWACLREYNSIAKHLIEKKALINVKDNAGITPYMIVKKQDNQKLIHIFRQQDYLEEYNQYKNYKQK